MHSVVIALIGNPNCGKTTLFNALTGAHQKVGNWPGVTIEKKTGTFQFGDMRVELVDLPGIYSIEQDYMGLDEKIARDFLDHEPIDVVINILDASNLERNLVLTQQVLDKGLHVVVALNMLDVAEQQGMRVDAARLSAKLGVPVVPIVASRGTGIEALQHLLLQAASSQSTAPRTVEEAAEPATARIVKRYHRAQQLVSGVVEVTPIEHSLTERIDRWVLNRWFGVPIFLLMMYVMFTVAVNLGAVFVDFFDILFGAVFVQGSHWLLGLVSAPEWLVTLLSDGLGGGIQLVATFIPVIGLLFLCLSILEDSGYLSRAAFVVDRVMAKIGLPGTSFVPLIVGFGCNVPAVMASRTLGRDSDRLLTIAMAPYMSCGARLTVYALFSAAMFHKNGQNVVFLLYLLGILMAVATGWIFRKQIFSSEAAPSFQEMPAYHLPVPRNILLTTWFRLRGFMFRAGKTIVSVVVVLSFLNSLSFDGTFGHQNTEKSALATIGKEITPVFEPIGLTRQNWPATVGLFTGLFAKETVVGTLDALYSGSVSSADVDKAPDLVGAAGAALQSIVDNGARLASQLVDPLGLSAVDGADDTAGAAARQGVASTTLTNMAAAFGSSFAAFCYLVFVLLYAPCVAVMGAMAKEAGSRWMALMFSWTTGLAYMVASAVHQVGTISLHPLYSMAWLAGCGTVLLLMIKQLKQLGRKAVPHSLIPVVRLG